MNSSDETSPLLSHQQAWEILSQTVLVDGSPWLKVSVEHVRLPNGVEINGFYRVDIPDYVKVFAVTDDGQVVINENYRHGPQTLSIELPAGMIDKNTTPLENAQRELLEETGMIAREWHYLGRYFVDGNRGCGWMHAFLAQGATYHQPPELESTELIQSCLIPLAQVREWWLTGKIQSAITIAVVGLAMAHLQSKP